MRSRPCCPPPSALPRPSPLRIRRALRQDPEATAGTRLLALLDDAVLVTAAGQKVLAAEALPQADLVGVYVGCSRASACRSFCQSLRLFWKDTNARLRPGPRASADTDWDMGGARGPRQGSPGTALRDYGGVLGLDCGRVGAWGPGAQDGGEGSCDDAPRSLLVPLWGVLARSHGIVFSSAAGGAHWPIAIRLYGGGGGAVVRMIIRRSGT